MKILHICLAGTYTEGMTYQENMLTNQNAADGHDVLIVSGCRCYKNGKIISIPPENCVLSNGVRLVRLPFDRIFTKSINEKIRKAKQLRPLIEQFAPDVILFHGCQGWELLTVAKYKKSHPNIKLYADNHAEFANSARNFISRNILHRLYYGFILRRAYSSIDRIFYTREERKSFLQILYKIPDEKLELYPLGGTIISYEKREQMRTSKRKQLGLGDDDILLCESGKLDDNVKRTDDLLVSFSHVDSDKMRLILIGSISDDSKPVLEPLIEADKRVTYMGWKNSDELLEYLCACDVYVHPGRHTVTIEEAMCCGVPVMVYPDEHYRVLAEKHGMSGNYYFVESVDDMEQAFRDILDNPGKLADMGRKSLQFAEKNLDYTKLARRYANEGD